MTEALLIWLGFGAAAVLTVVVSARRMGPLIASLVLLVAWCADTTMGVMHVDAEVHRDANLALDVAFALGFLGVWWWTYYAEPKRRWLFAVALTYAVEVWAHWAQGDAPSGWAYKATMNALCALQFVIVALAERPLLPQVGDDARRSITGGDGRGCRAVRSRGVGASLDEQAESIGRSEVWPLP